MNRAAQPSPGPAVPEHRPTGRSGGTLTPYTRQNMDSGLVGEMAGGRLDEAYAEAGQLVSYVANQLRAITERYREHYGVSLAVRRRESEREAGGDARLSAVENEPTPEEVGRRQLELAKLELAVTHLERTWLFLQHGDATLVPEPGTPDLPTDLQMRIVEAQEAERQRLAQEVHDGPAQALTNAIFQVEYITDRLLDKEPVLARTEMRYLRDLLRRELDDVRSFITQLRPPLLDEIGLYGAIRDHADTLSSATGVSIDVHLVAPPERLGDTQQTVMLRIVQEALQNIRRHAQAEHVRIVTRVDDDPDEWILEIHDDGRGFDPAQLNTQRGTRSFGLRFMRERANLIGARLDLESRPGAGTHICVALPGGTERR